MTPREAVEEAVKQLAEDREGRLHLPCSQALELAERLQVEPRLVGQVCDDLKVKLHQCKLGCF